LRVRLLKIPGPDLIARDMRGDGEHGNARSLGVEESVDEVKVSWATAPRAHRDLSCESRLGARGERRRLLVAHVHPFDAVRHPQGIGEAVERIAGKPVDASHPAREKSVDDVLGERGHGYVPSRSEEHTSELQ